MNLARKNPQNLMVCVQIANQFIVSVLWYMLQLWPGDLNFLVKLDNLVKDFIWSDQDVEKKSSIKYSILLLPKEEGGLGLISI